MSIVAVGTLHAQEDARRENVRVQLLRQDFHFEKLLEAPCKAGPRTDGAKTRLQLLQQEFRLRRQSTGTFPSPVLPHFLSLLCFSFKPYCISFFRSIFERILENGRTNANIAQRHSPVKGICR